MKIKWNFVDRKGDSYEGLGRIRIEFLIIGFVMLILAILLEDVGAVIVTIVWLGVRFFIPILLRMFIK